MVFQLVAALRLVDLVMQLYLLGAPLSQDFLSAAEAIPRFVDDMETIHEWPLLDERDDARFVFAVF